MPKPQQPELRRSGGAATDDDSAKANVDDVPPTSGGLGPVPPDNQAGHHPEHEQDKPEWPPPATAHQGGDVDA
jgi:hypothetical protein